MKNAALWSSLRIRRISVLAAACLVPVVGCSETSVTAPEHESTSELPNRSPTSDAASGKARPDASSPDSSKDTSTLEPVGDAAVDAFSDSAADARDATSADAGVATDPGVVLRSGDVPVPTFSRVTYVGRRITFPGDRCPAGTQNYGIAASGSGSCCYEHKSASLSKPVLLTNRLVAGVEKVCLEGTLVGGPAALPLVCSPVDARGIARFEPSTARRSLYSYWGLYPSGDPPRGNSLITVQLSSSRDIASISINHQGPEAVTDCQKYSGLFGQMQLPDIPLL